MKSYSIRYRLAPRVEEVKELLVEAPDAKAAAEKARQVLGLRYPHHRIEGITPGIRFDTDAAELCRRPASSGGG